MIDIIRSDNRGAADHGWLRSKHTFSFADYHNPDRMGFAKLRVVNEDWIEPGQGFGAHPHRDMEIVTYMIDGALEHKDSMGNGSVIRPGELQRMSAGTGVLHSEFNHSKEEKAHLLQIWILPEQNGLQPGYEQKLFDRSKKLNRWRLVGSHDGRDGSLTIHQDVSLYSTELERDEELEYRFNGRRRGFLQVVKGAIEIDAGEIDTGEIDTGEIDTGEIDTGKLLAGDAIATQDQHVLNVRANENAELLLFDMA